MTAACAPGLFLANGSLQHSHLPSTHHAMKPLLRSPSLPFRTPTLFTAITNNNSSSSSKRNKGRPRPTIRSFRRTALRKAFSSLAASLPNPLDLLLILHYGDGGGGGGGLGFPSGGLGGDWFGRRKRRAAKLKGLVGLLVSLAVGSGAWGSEKRADWDLAVVRVSILVILGLGIGNFKRWFGVLALGFAVSLLLLSTRRGKGLRKWSGWRW